MKKILLITLLILLLVPIAIYAFVLPVPFGGRVVSTKPCDEGLLLTLKNTSGTSFPYMWFWGNLPYSYRVVPHIGQWILGMGRSGGVPCTVSGVPYAGGVPITYHGSSL